MVRSEFYERYAKEQNLSIPAAQALADPVLDCLANSNICNLPDYERKQWEKPKNARDWGQSFTQGQMANYIVEGILNLGIEEFSRRLILINRRPELFPKNGEVFDPAKKEVLARNGVLGKCAFCGVDFQKKKNDQKYCCSNCRNNAYSKAIHNVKIEAPTVKSVHKEVVINL